MSGPLRPFPHPAGLGAELEPLLSLVPRDVDRLLEPFVGSGVFTLAAARADLARTYVVGDDLDPLVAIWQLLIERPKVLTQGYAAHMAAARDLSEIRADWERCRDPVGLLYLLHGAHPVAPPELERRLQAIHQLLRARTITLAGDFSLLLRSAQPEDMVFLDPPAFGEADSWHPPWHVPLTPERLHESLEDAVERGVRFAVLHSGDHGLHKLMSIPVGSRWVAASPALVTSLRAQGLAI